MIMQNLVLLLFLLASGVVLSSGNYLEPEDFIQQAFAGEPPNPRVIWLTGELKQQFKHITGHDPASLRQRYWAKAQRSVWILEEIGKSEPITVGVVINRDKIEQLKVLIFRESRGDEVRYPFFTEQFRGAGLSERQQLDQSIDGISGATLSVRALRKIARLALLLHQQRSTDEIASK